MRPIDGTPRSAGMPSSSRGDSRVVNYSHLRNLSDGGTCPPKVGFKYNEAFADYLMRRSAIDHRIEKSGTAFVRTKTATTKKERRPGICGFLRKPRIETATETKKVYGVSFESLANADATVSEVRKMLKFGRGNVSTDTAESLNDSMHRMEAGRDVAAYLVGTGKLPADMPYETIAAAAAAYAGAGNCYEHAALAYHLHPEKMTRGDHIEMVGNDDVDHMWVESMVKGGCIAMDPWAEGPAVAAEDSQFSLLPDNKRGFGHDREPAKKAGREADSLLKHLEADKDIRIFFNTRLYEYRGETLSGIDYQTYPPTPVFSEAFINKTDNALASMSRESRLMHRIWVARLFTDTRTVSKAVTTAEKSEHEYAPRKHELPEPQESTPREGASRARTWIDLLKDIFTIKEMPM